MFRTHGLTIRQDDIIDNIGILTIPVIHQNGLVNLFITRRYFKLIIRKHMILECGQSWL